MSYRFRSCSSHLIIVNLLHVHAIRQKYVRDHGWPCQSLLDLRFGKLGAPLLLRRRDQIADVLPVDVFEGRRVVEARLAREVLHERVKTRVQAMADHVDVCALDGCH